MIEENNDKESKLTKSIPFDKSKNVPQNIPVISSEEQKQLEELLSTNVKVIQNPKIQRVNTNIIEEIFSENLDSIVMEIDK